MVFSIVTVSIRKSNAVTNVEIMKTYRKDHRFIRPNDNTKLPVSITDYSQD